MLGFFTRFFRKRRAIKMFGCYCLCPQCNEILNDSPEHYIENDKGVFVYRCRLCNTESRFLLDTPVPILLEAKALDKRNAN